MRTEDSSIRWRGRLACERPRNWQDQVQIETSKGQNRISRRKSQQRTTMVRSLLFLALVASVFSSANAAAQVGSGGIRGSSTATESSSPASSALASAASSLLKVWPHPAAQVLHHATNAVRRKMVSFANINGHVAVFVTCSVS